MDIGTLEVLFWVFLFGLVVMGYELTESLKPPACRQCAHCQAVKEEERRRQAELRETLGRQYGMRDADDDRWRH